MAKKVRPRLAAVRRLRAAQLAAVVKSAESIAVGKSSKSSKSKSK